MFYLESCLENGLKKAPLTEPVSMHSLLAVADANKSRQDQRSIFLVVASSTSFLLDKNFFVVVTI